MEFNVSYIELGGYLKIRFPRMLGVYDIDSPEPQDADKWIS